MILPGRLLMALVLVCVASVTLAAIPTDDNEARFALIHKQYLSDVANCDGLGPTQYPLCRELAFETFIAEARLIK